MIKKPLFVIGNKRSGTSLLVHCLDDHPNIFMTRESDILWILYKFFNNQPLQHFGDDGPVGMNYTLSKCRNMLDQRLTPYQNFCNIQTFLMTHGSLSLKPMNKKHILYLGDKKPKQTIAPEIQKFLFKYFSDAKFIHLIRHPSCHAQSIVFHKAMKGKKTSVERVFQKWIKYEMLADQMKKRYSDSIIDVRYEDLVREPIEELKKIYTFLGVSKEASIFDVSKKRMDLGRLRLEDEEHKKFYVGETKQVMERFGYI